MLASAKKDLTRYSNLARDKFGTMQSVDQQTGHGRPAHRLIQGDAATIAAARLNLDFTQIKAPITGRVGLRQVDAGNLIHASDAQGIVTINQIHPIAVMFSLPQDDLPQVQAAMQRGRALPVRAASSDGKMLLGQGTLLTIDNTVDAATGNFKLKATFPNAARPALAGAVRACPDAGRHAQGRGHGALGGGAARAGRALCLRRGTGPARVAAHGHGPAGRRPRGRDRERHRRGGDRGGQRAVPTAATAAGSRPALMGAGMGEGRRA